MHDLGIQNNSSETILFLVFINVHWMAFGVVFSIVSTLNFESFCPYSQSHAFCARISSTNTHTSLSFS